jgi:hypothetical protein
MWRMTDGDRVLTDAECEVFSTGLDLLRCEVETDISDQTDGAETGIRVFDRLTAEQKLALLADVTLALRDPTVPAPRHTACNEGAIVAVLVTFEDMLRTEVESDERGTELRGVLLAAFSPGEDGPTRLPKRTARRWDDWVFLLECFESRVLWDADYEMGDHFLDLPPEEAREKLTQMTIDPDYYLAVPDEPDRQRLIRARQTLAKVLGLAVPDGEGLYPALVDLFHDLHVGPVTPEEVATWEKHPWVLVIGSPEPGWDCDYKTWKVDFATGLPAAPFQVSPAAPGASYELPPGMRVVQTPEGWGVRQEDGSYWCGLVDNCWTGEPDEDVPVLTFPSEEDAKAAYCQADRLYGEVVERRRTAYARLGLSG